MKPAVGAIDFVSKTTEGIRNTTTMNDKQLERSRLPRTIGADRVVKVRLRIFIEFIDFGFRNLKKKKQKEIIY